MLSVFSLCSGIGGLDEGLRRAGHEHVAFCEGSPDEPATGEYRRAVLARRFPGVPVFEDVASLRVEPAAGAARDGRVTVSDGAGRVHTVAVPGLVSFGFPCQDLSVAGQRAGLGGNRSGLFFECARIVDALRPRWILVENVPGLLSSQGGRDFGLVLGTLADLGYGVAWRILDSRFFGVPQRRRRVFIVGTLADGDPRAAAERAGEVLAVCSRCPGHPATRGETRQDDPSPPLSGTLGGRRGFTGDDIDRGGHTSLSGLGNGGPDDNDAQAGRLVVANTLRSNERNTSQGPGNYVTHSLTSEGHDASEDGTGRGTPIIAVPLTSGGHPNSNTPGRRKEDDENLVVARALTSSVERQDASVETIVVSSGFNLGRGGNSDICLEEENQPPITGSHGNPGGVLQAYPLARRGRDGGSELEVGEPGIYNALRAGDGGSSRLNQVMVGLSVRRLTPTECERLQGLPDGWTLLDDTTPDSRRYSALGDAVTANVAEWIGGRLAA